MVRRLIPDYDFIMDVDDSFIDNFVNVPSGRPNLLMDFLEKRDNDVTHKRFLTFYNNPEYESLDQDERAVTHRLLKEDKFDEALDYHIKYALDFLEKYPQFKPMIKGVKEV